MLKAEHVGFCIYWISISFYICKCLWAQALAALVYIFLAYKAFGLAQAVLQSPNYDVAIP